MKKHINVQSKHLRLDKSGDIADQCFPKMGDKAFVLPVQILGNVSFMRKFTTISRVCLCSYVYLVAISVSENMN